MSGYRRSRGASPLLFERLVDPRFTPAMSAGSRTSNAPTRLHTIEDLSASIARELEDLFNTRTPLPIDGLERRQKRTAIDYGIPDLSAFPLGEHEAVQRLARHIEEAVLAFEPRLQEPAVAILPDPRSAGAMIAVIRGTVRLEKMRVPVSFEMKLPGASVGQHAA
jgi:type VI secretion system lysozyme-related protein